MTAARQGFLAPTDGGAERFRLLVESVRDYAIYTLDLDGIVTSWNAGARQIKGYEADEVIGSRFSRFFTPQDIQRGWPQHLLAMAKELDHYEDEGWRLRKDGSRFWCNAVLTTMRDASGSAIGYAKITRDLTERHYHEEELAQSAKREREHAQVLEDAVGRMREFIAMLAHEIRNPLAPICNAVALMAKKPALDSDTEALRRTIERQSAFLTRLADDLVDVNRIEQGGFAIAREPVVITDVLSRAVEASRPYFEAKDQTLHLQWPEEQITLLGDSIRLTQAVVNLLNNAARYTERAGHISLLVDSSDGVLTIRVVDTGKGIEPTELPNIFEPFRQLAPQEKDSARGLGLGLALVRRIVEGHGGTVEAKSAGAGRGSEFVVTLPLEKLAAPPQPEALESVPRRARPVRILCVDDDPSIGRSLARLLDSMGHVTRTAFDGAAAIREAQTFCPEIVLLDVSMPGMSGYEVADRLLEQRPDPPPMLVCLTGWGEERHARLSQQHGFQRHLLKPVTEEILESLIASFVSGRDG